jgi:glucose uptake protein
MVIVSNYTVAVMLCILAMVSWGSWQNTRNMGSREWRFELYYWDFVLGILLFSLLSAFTIGSLGTSGRTFLEDLAQAEFRYIGSAMLGGAIWNLGTLLLTAGIAIAGMSVAFPIGGGLGWLLGIFILYLQQPSRNPVILFSGCVVIILAIILSMVSYRRLAASQKKPSLKGILFSLLAGIAIAFFYRFVNASLDKDFLPESAGKLTPYTAVFFFSLGALLTTFIYNPIFMRYPADGPRVSIREYFSGKGRDHTLGLLGGAIWCTGNIASFMAVHAASPAIAYGLSNAAPVVAALWGIFVWKEFRGAPAGTNRLLFFMFLAYLTGLVLITMSNA